MRGGRVLGVQVLYRHEHAGMNIPPSTIREAPKTVNACIGQKFE